ncbi:serine/threonine-protein phosphatase 5-like [Penaeus monodon]|uniref:serine/threonine-protein phosphatase 5-like n=1 Tax=Penaeus monodon TaxID=6687 RepID=UPI0018A799A3|nr:serine/threonine-protein phosphatase 5-like [Penaeus monodon]
MPGVLKDHASSSLRKCRKYQKKTLRKQREIKSEANEYFKKQQYDKAIELYTEAIELNNTVAVYYGNRSFAYLRTECFGYALQDASKALELIKTMLRVTIEELQLTCHLENLSLPLRIMKQLQKHVQMIEMQR